MRSRWAWHRWGAPSHHRRGHRRRPPAEDVHAPHPLLDARTASDKAPACCVHQETLDGLGRLHRRLQAPRCSRLDPRRRFPKRSAAVRRSSSLTCDDCRGTEDSALPRSMPPQPPRKPAIMKARPGVPRPNQARAVTTVSAPGGTCGTRGSTRLANCSRSDGAPRRFKTD